MKDTWKQEFDIQLLKNQLEKRKKYPRGVPAEPSPEELREPRQRDEEKARKEAKHALKCKLAWKIVPLMVCQRAVRAMEAGKRKPRGAPPRAARRAPGTWSDSEPTGTGPRTGAQGPLATTATPHRVSTTRAAGQLHRTRLGGGPSGSQGGPQTAAPRYSAGVPTEARSVRAAGAPPSAGTQTVASSPDHPRHSRQCRAVPVGAAAAARAARRSEFRRSASSPRAARRCNPLCASRCPSPIRVGDTRRLTGVRLRVLRVSTVT